MTDIQRVAASELLAVHDLAMKSGSRDVQAFGMMMLARIADFCECDDKQPYMLDEQELIEAGEMWGGIE